MFDPVYNTVENDAAVLAALADSNGLRVHSFGDASQKGEKPYAVTQIVGGSPDNYLAGRPDADSLIVQVDVYGKHVVDVRAAVVALLGALEEAAHITAWLGENRELDTKLWRKGFTVEFKASR